jgi:enoyl-CoA hydratase/carnithine racemase
VVEPGKVLPAALAYAERLAGLPAFALQETKFVLNQQLRRAALGALALGLAAESQAHDLEPYREAAERSRTR